MSEPNDNKKKLVIKGMTESGETFRPSNWAERMSGNLCTFRNHKIIYSPLLQPTVREGYQSIVVDMALKESNPALFEMLLDFAKTNKLTIQEEDKDSN